VKEIVLQNNQPCSHNFVINIRLKVLQYIYFVLTSEYYNNIINQFVLLNSTGNLSVISDLVGFLCSSFKQYFPKTQLPFL